MAPATYGVPNASERGTRSEVAHKGAGWLHNPCYLGHPQRFRAGGGGDHRWPTSGLGGYITLAAWRVSNTSERGIK